MRAIRAHGLEGLGSLALDEVPEPEAGPGEVVVEVAAAALNFPDLLMLEGKYQHRPALPFSPGLEAAGVVAAAGAGVERLRPGMRVMVQLSHGGFAEKIAVSERSCFVVPDAMPLEVAAAMGIVYQTAHLALVDRARVEPGETVLVAGASGGVGVAAMQLAKAFGCRVFAGLTSMAKADLAAEHGAEAAVDLETGDLRDAVRERVFALTEGRGVDVVIDMVGGEVFAGALRALAWRGRLVVVGFTSGVIPELRTNYLLLKNIAVLGLSCSQYQVRQPDLVARIQDEIFGLWAEGKLQVPIQARLPAERFAEAFALMHERGMRGKVVLAFAGG